MRETDVVRRAYELAPEASNIDDLARRLKREGFINVDAHFASKTLRGALSKSFKG